MRISVYRYFFFNDTATTEIYTLSLHDALPISRLPLWRVLPVGGSELGAPDRKIVAPPRTHERSCEKGGTATRDRKSTRLNSSHANISYAVFCLKKKQFITTSPSLSSVSSTSDL